MSQISGTWWEAVAPWDKWWANLNLMEVWHSALSWFLIGSAIMLCFPSIFHYTLHRQQFYSYCWENTVQERGNLFRFWSKADRRELEKLRILARWQVCLSERVSCSVMFNSLWPSRLLHPWDFPGKNTEMHCHFLLQGIFMIQGSNLGLLHCRQTLFFFFHLFLLVGG